MRSLAAASAAALAASASLAEENPPFYFQATVADQAHHQFHAPYSGKNSLRPDAESALSVVMDLGVRIHPAYNRDRGPVHIFTARAHVAF
jgi:hypothetical protein